MTQKKRVFLPKLSAEGILIIIRFICLFLFLYTAYAKLVDHERFLKGLSNVHIIIGFGPFISWFVPISEIITSLLLLFPKSARWGLYTFTGLMILFTGYIGSALIWETSLPCHCGGVIEKLSWIQHLWFNLAFIAIAAVGIWLKESRHI